MEKALRPDDSRYYSTNREKFIPEFEQTRKMGSIIELVPVLRFFLRLTMPNYK